MPYLLSLCEAQPSSQWTSDQDLRQACMRAGLGDKIVPRETTFFEHKVNGKSRGTAYIEFSDPSAVPQMKDWLDNKWVFASLGFPSQFT